MTLLEIIHLLVSIATAMIGFRIHNSLFWSFVNFIFPVISWIKWLICGEVNITLIKEAFNSFLK